MVRALASHQCGPGSSPGVDAACGLSLLLVLSFAPRGFSPGTLVFLSPQKPTNQGSGRRSENHSVDVLLVNHYLFILHLAILLVAFLLRDIFKARFP